MARRLLAALLLVALLIPPLPARAQSSEADVFVAAAILAYEDKRYDEAVGLLNQALQIDPENVDAYYYLGLSNLAQGKREPAVEALEKARARSPEDLAVLTQLGVTYFTLEQYDKAEPLLTRVFSVAPRTDGVGYYVGFMRYRKKDYQGALRAFQTGATQDPDLQQLTRFYTGLTLAQLNLPERAAAEVEEALRLQPTSPLTGPAERLRDTLAASRAREKRFSAELRLGVFHDSNVPLEPEPSNDPVAEQVRQAIGTRKSFGQLYAARFEYAWLRKGPWESSVAYSFFQTVNNNIPKLNLQNHLGAVGVTYRDAFRGLPYQAGLSFTYDYLTLDNDEFLQRKTVILSASLVENERNVTTGLFRYQHKEFSNDSNIPLAEVRDANNYLLGFIHRLRFGTDHYVQFGYQLDVEDTESGRNFDYVGNRLNIGGLYTYKWDEYVTRFRYDYDVHFREYTRTHLFLPLSARPPLAAVLADPSLALNPRDPKRRSDIEQTHFFRIEQPLTPSFTLNFDYQIIINRSNLPVFAFNRNVATLSVSWLYDR
jgi:tetratricopeptide (TPR) repeat protein